MSIIRQIKQEIIKESPNMEAIENPIVQNRVYEFIDLNNIKTLLPANTDNLLKKNLEKYENCAYTVNSEAGQFYFIKVESGYIFDPVKDSPSYRKRLWKWKKVNKKAYEVYAKFLKEKKTRLLSVVEKLI